MATSTLAIESVQQEASLRALDSLSLASALAAAVRRGAKSASIARKLWKVEAEVKKMLARTNGIIEGKIKTKPAAEPVSKAQIETLIDTLDMLARTIDDTQEAGKRLGLTNNSLTAGSLRSLNSHREGILDLADWLDANLNSSENEKIFNRARQEREKGQVFDLDQVI